MVWAIIWFTVGIASALLTGFSAIYQITRLIPDQSAFLELRPGSYERMELSVMVEGEAEPPDEWRDPIILFGFSSFIFFCIGVGILAAA